MNCKTLSLNYTYPRYIIITPVRDEERYISLTLDSVIQQTIKPILWVIVNDGSTDTTGKILNKYAVQYEWIKVVHGEDRGYRAAGSGVITAFNKGYACIDIENWDFIVKLDGDLSFESDYFEKCFSLFADDDVLGIAGGTVLNNKDGILVVDSIGDPPFHVRGATKIYRRGCWEKICPLMQAPGWDTIDEVKANFYGWTTRTFPEIQLIQHKPTGGADGHWHNWVKNGLANYITGYHPMFMLAKCFKRILQKPIFIASMGLWFGFCSGYWEKTPQVQDNDVIRYLRRNQLRYMLRLPSIYG